LGQRRLFVIAKIAKQGEVRLGQHRRERQDAAGAARPGRLALLDLEIGGVLSCRALANGTIFAPARGTAR
jgi:hypothetical protein